MADFEDEPGDDPLAPAGQRKRIGSASPAGDNYAIWTNRKADPFAGAIDAAFKPNQSPLEAQVKGTSGDPGVTTSHGTAAWSNPAPVRTDIGSSNPNDAYGTPKTNSGVQDRPAPPRRNALDEIRPPDLQAVPAPNWAAQMGGHGGLSRIFSNQGQIQAAVQENARREQDYNNRLKLAEAQTSSQYARNLGDDPQWRHYTETLASGQKPDFGEFNRLKAGAANVNAGKRSYSQLMADALAHPDQYDTDTVSAAQAYQEKQGAQKQQTPEQVLMDPKASAADKATAERVLRLTHPAIANQTQSVDDIQESAKALVAALHGDPSQVTTLQQLGGFGNKKTAIYAAAKRLDPTFNTSQLERMARAVNNFTTATQPGSGNMQLRAVNTFAQHSADLQDAISDPELARTESQLLNQPLSYIQQKVTSNPKMSTLQTAIMAPAMEYLRLINNGGAPYKEEREDMAKTLPPTMTVGQAIAATKEMGQVVSRRFDSLDSEFRRGTGHGLLETIPDAISPQGRNALQRLGVNLGGGGAAPGTGVAPQGGGQPKYKEGDVSPSGKYVVRGGKWVPKA